MRRPALGETPARFPGENPLLGRAGLSDIDNCPTLLHHPSPHTSPHVFGGCLILHNRDHHDRDLSQ